MARCEILALPLMEGSEACLSSGLLIDTLNPQINTHPVMQLFCQFVMLKNIMLLSFSIVIIYKILKCFRSKNYLTRRKSSCGKPQEAYRKRRYLSLGRGEVPQSWPTGYPVLAGTPWKGPGTSEPGYPSPPRYIYLLQQHKEISFGNNISVKYDISFLWGGGGHFPCDTMAGARLFRGRGEVRVLCYTSIQHSLGKWVSFAETNN